MGVTIGISEVQTPAKKEDYPDELHPSHFTRTSDASTFDEICTLCGATDQVPSGWGNLKFPCRGSST